MGEQRTPGRRLSDVARVRLLLRLVAAGFALLLYVWYAAVRNVPEARRRRRAKHPRRRTST
jgi:hypothetical protein